MTHRSQAEGRGAERDEMSKWIDVVNRLPEYNRDVWIYDGDMGVTIGSYSCHGNWYDVYGDNDGLGDDRLYHVTHWMPIDKPNPPELKGTK